MQADPDQSPVDHGTALLVVDVQQALCELAPPAAMAAVLASIQSLLAWADSHAYPVIFVQHFTEPGSILERGSTGWQLADGLRDYRPAFHVEKNTLNSFDDGSLHSWLQERRIERLCIAGMQTEHCINAACHGAINLGYAVVLPVDAHMTIDGPEMSALEIVEDYNDRLANIARCLPTCSLIAEDAGAVRGL
jgi:nicotinamidase-related amidase